MRRGPHCAGAAAALANVSADALATLARDGSVGLDDGSLSTSMGALAALLTGSGSGLSGASVARAGAALSLMEEMEGENSRIVQVGQHHVA